jgi:hypothetical protein
LAQGRRVRLIVRRVEPWTVLKFSVLLYITLYLVILVAGGVLWTAATVTGLRENIEKFIGDLIASDDFHLLGGTVAKASVLGGMVMVVMGTGVNVLLAVLYNLISDVVGGVVVQFEERPRRRDRAAHEGVAAEPAPPVLRPARGSAIAAVSERVARVRTGLRERAGPVADDTAGAAELEGGQPATGRRPG